MQCDISLAGYHICIISVQLLREIYFELHWSLEGSNLLTMSIRPMFFLAKFLIRIITRIARYNLFVLENDYCNNLAYLFFDISKVASTIIVLR